MTSGVFRIKYMLKSDLDTGEKNPFGHSITKHIQLLCKKKFFEKSPSSADIYTIRYFWYPHSALNSKNAYFCSFLPDFSGKIIHKSPNFNKITRNLKILFHMHVPYMIPWFL